MIIKPEAIWAVASFAAFLFSLVYIYRLRETIKQRDRDIVDLKAIRLGKTEELTDFLADFQHHGYAFTRIDPNDFFLRTSRD